jgi:predicted flap endonuclease-1-like 5' DNA nuclease
MFELIAANWPAFAVAFIIGLATAWWVWARHRIEADVATPKIEASAPKAVADLAKEMPAATEPVKLMDAAPVAAAAVAAPKAKAAPAPKAKAAPVRKAAAPKAKVETPKVKAAPAPKAKVAPAKAAPVKAAPAKAAAPKAKVEAPKAKVAPKPAAKTAVKPVAKAAPKPKPAAKPKAAPKPVIPDNLELLKGVGPKLNTLLKSLGITSFSQVASWNAADVAEVDSKLGNFAGRITRDNWIDQSKLLVAGDIKGFEKKYGALGSEITK